MTFTPLLDTFLNLGTFAFIALLIWLYTKAPTDLCD